MKTIQQAFTVAVTALLRQGERSVDPVTEVCQYRGLNGLKCAVGHLLSDENYTIALESMTPDGNYDPITGENTFAVKAALKADGWPVDPKAIGIYMDIQGVHDTKEPIIWSHLFGNIARKHGLEYCPEESDAFEIE